MVVVKKKKTFANKLFLYSVETQLYPITISYDLSVKAFLAKVNNFPKLVHNKNDP